MTPNSPPSDLFGHPLLVRLMPTVRGALYIDRDGVRNADELHVLAVELDQGERFVAATPLEIGGLGTLYNHIALDEDVFRGVYHVVRTNHPLYALYLENGYTPEDTAHPTFAYALQNDAYAMEWLDNASTPYVFETSFTSRTAAMQHAISFLTNRSRDRIYLHEGPRETTVSWHETTRDRHVTRIHGFAYANDTVRMLGVQDVTGDDDV